MLSVSSARTPRRPISCGPSVSVYDAEIGVDVGLHARRLSLSTSRPVASGGGGVVRRAGERIAEAQDDPSACGRRPVERAVGRMRAVRSTTSAGATASLGLIAGPQSRSSRHQAEARLLLEAVHARAGVQDKFIDLGTLVPRAAPEGTEA